MLVYLEFLKLKVTTSYVVKLVKCASKVLVILRYFVNEGKYLAYENNTKSEYNIDTYVFDDVF